MGGMGGMNSSHDTGTSDSSSAKEKADAVVAKPCSSKGSSAEPVQACSQADLQQRLMHEANKNQVAQASSTGAASDTGFVIYWSGIQGFGLLRSQTHEYIFMPAKALTNTRELVVGDVVTFSMGWDEKKGHAEAKSCFKAGVAGKLSRAARSEQRSAQRDRPHEAAGEPCDEDSDPEAPKSESGAGEAGGVGNGKPVATKAGGPKRTLRRIQLKRKPAASSASRTSAPKERRSTVQELLSRTQSQWGHESWTFHFPNNPKYAIHFNLKKNFFRGKKREKGYYTCKSFSVFKRGWACALKLVVTWCTSTRKV